MRSFVHTHYVNDEKIISAYKTVQFLISRWLHDLKKRWPILFLIVWIHFDLSLNNSLFSDIQNSASRQSMRQPVDQGEFKTIDEVLTCSNKIQSQCQDNEVKYIKYCTYYLNRFHCLHFPQFSFYRHTAKNIYPIYESALR